MGQFDTGADPHQPHFSKAADLAFAKVFQVKLVYQEFLHGIRRNDAHGIGEFLQSCSKVHCRAEDVINVLLILTTEPTADPVPSPTRARHLC